MYMVQITGTVSTVLPPAPAQWRKIYLKSSKTLPLYKYEFSHFLHNPFTKRSRKTIMMFSYKGNAIQILLFEHRYRKAIEFINDSKCGLRVSALLYPFFTYIFYIYFFHTFSGSNSSGPSFLLISYLFTHFNLLRRNLERWGSFSHVFLTSSACLPVCEPHILHLAFAGVKPLCLPGGMSALIDFL